MTDNILILDDHNKKLLKKSKGEIVYNIFLMFFVICILVILIFFLVAGVKTVYMINDLKNNVEDQFTSTFGSWQNLTLFIDKVIIIIDEACELSSRCQALYG